MKTILLLCLMLLGGIVANGADATDPRAPGTSDRVEYEYDRVGELVKKTDQNGTVHEYDYNDFNQLKEDKQAHTSTTSASSPQVGYSFADGTDNTIRLTKTTYPDGREIDSVYNTGMDDYYQYDGLYQVKQRDQGTLR